MGSPAELERIYDAHASALFAFLLNMTRHEADTRDLLQDLFAKLASQPDLLHDLRNERAFLLRLARNAAIDLLRRRHVREPEPENPDDSPPLFVPSISPDEQAFRTALAAALATLPTDQREVVHLKLWEGLTFEAIAAILEVSPNTAASRYRYGLDKLRAQLRPLYDEIR